LSIACAIATFVPTPSVEVASSGFVAEQRRGVEEAGEPADAAEHLGPVGATNGRLHQFDGEISRRGVDAGFGIGILWGFCHANSLPAGAGRADRRRRSDAPCRRAERCP
jgi:hypothetical protein